MVKGRKAGWLALAIIFCVALAPVPANAALQAYVDRNPVSLDESFTLTLESDEDLDGSPDLSPLQQDFDILNQSRSSSFRMINGATSHKTQWQISLAAKHTGRVTIPAIRIGGKETAAISVNVTAASTPPVAENGTLFLQVKAEPRSVYVQQEIVYTVSLYSAVDLGNNSTLSEPTLPGSDAVVEKLGKDRNFQTVRNGMRYDVVERRYAIYPQKSGSFVVPPLIFEGEVVQGGGGGGFFAFDPFRTSVRHQRLRSQEVSFDVKPAPASFQGGQWLPARHLDLVEHWSENPPTFIVGQPITRTLSIMAEGLTASQLPTLTKGSINGLKQYPDQPKLSDNKDGNGITGERTESVAYIPTQPGHITLPAVAIPWWNTVTNTPEVARLSQRTVEVAPAPGNSGTSPAPSPAQAPSSVSSKEFSEPKPLAAPIAHGFEATRSNAGIWPWVSLLLGIGWLSTIVLWIWWARRDKRSVVSAIGKRGPSLQTLERAVEKSCIENDASGTRTNLLTWARARWPNEKTVSLADLATRCDPRLAAALRLLDSTLYAPTSNEWEGSRFWETFKRHKSKGPEVRALGKKSSLEHLYNS